MTQRNSTNGKKEMLFFHSIALNSFIGFDVTKKRYNQLQYKTQSKFVYENKKY